MIIDSPIVTGSFTVMTGSSVELQVTNTGVKIGNTTADVHTITGSLNISSSAAVISATEIGYLSGSTSNLQTQINNKGYTLMAGAISSNTTSGVNMYIGMASRVVSGTASVSRVYIPQSGIVKRIDLVSSSATAGTAEAWTMSFRLTSGGSSSNTTIATVTSATTTRVWSNNLLSIVVAAGDYFEITALNPTWATNPGATSYYATVYIQ